MYPAPSPLAASCLSFSPPFPKIAEIPLLNSLIPTSWTHFSVASNPKVIGSRSRKWTTHSQKGENPSVTVASPTSAKIDDDNVLYSASEVVSNFYGGINIHDLDSVEDLISENCVYEVLIFSSTFVGRKNGRESLFPLAKDAAFIVCRYGRDSVEPAFKPGDTALAVIRSVTWLLQQFPQLAD